MKTLSKTELAVMMGRTLFPTTLKDTTKDILGKTENVIKQSTNIKLGKRVTKGSLKGAKIFTVTLEERKTCPTSCAHWADCYGNNMPFATRYAANDDLEERMEKELAELQRKNPTGFLVRLHILGDFYSVGYVAKWGAWLTKFPALHVYGYTANQPDAIDAKERSIGQAIQTIRAASADDERAAPLVEAKKAFICPVQLDKTASCGSCGACWSSTKPVVFLTH